MPIPAAVAAAAPLVIKGVSAVGNFLSGIFTNRSKERMNRENNQLQRELADKKWERDVQMWNMQNEYNTPAAQAQRLLDAGMNPYLQNVSTGMAESAPSAPMANTTVADIQAPQVNLDGIADTLFNQQLMRQEVEGKQLENEGKRIENRYKESRTIAELNDLRMRTAGTSLNNDAIKLQNDFFKETRENRLKLLGQEVQQKVLENKQLETHLSYLPEEKRLGVQLLASEVAKMAVERGLTAAQIRKVVMDSQFVQESLNGLKLDNKQKKAVMNTMIRTAEYNMIKSSWDALDSKWRSVHTKNNSNADNWWQESYNKANGDIFRGLNAASGAVTPFKFFN